MNKKTAKNRRPVEIKEKYHKLTSDTKKGILIILFCVCALISLLSFFNLAGMAGIYINLGLQIAFGATKFLFPFILLFISYILYKPGKFQTGWVTYLGLTLLLLSLDGFIHLLVIRNDLRTPLEVALNGDGGGLAGLILGLPLWMFLGAIAASIILVALIFISILLVFNTTLEVIFSQTKLSSIFSIFTSNPFQKAEEEEEEVELLTADDEDEEEESKTEYSNDSPARKENYVMANDNDHAKKVDPKTAIVAEALEKYSHFKDVKIDLPLSLLTAQATKPKSGDIGFALERIETTLKNFGIEVEMGDVSVGPTVTQYTFKPADGIKLSRITGLNNDLALALAAHPIRIEAPIPGKSLVGIEVPNTQPATVPLRLILESDEFKARKTNLMIGLGKDVSGKAWSTILEKMPHLLVAGATGSGKSVCLNTIIVSLLYQNTPETLRLILVDPKRVEFTVYNGIPHLLTPVITDVTKTINALRWAIQEMDQRFDVLSKEGKRNIQSFNEIAVNKMPYIVIIIDELADLMSSASAEVEACIIRLTQMARAVGIHLVVATQRPSVDIITGVIKANIPGRIAFSVASSMDSRTILDSIGAEKLIGKGDMLLQTADMSKPRRLQGAFISDNEIKRIVNFLKQTGIEPEYAEGVTEKHNTKTSFDFTGNDDDDTLLDEAHNVVVQAGKASASLLQRRLRVGYARAARLLDLLEERGIIGPSDGAKPREILISAADMETPTVFKSSFLSDEPKDDNEDAQEFDDEQIEPLSKASIAPKVVAVEDSEDEEEETEEDDDNENQNNNEEEDEESEESEEESEKEEEEESNLASDEEEEKDKENNDPFGPSAVYKPKKDF